MDLEEILKNTTYRDLLDNIYEGVYFVDPSRQILYWSKSAEKITGFTAREVQGFHCYDNILVHVDEKGQNMCQTTCPLAKCLVSGKDGEAEAYLHHKEGHRIPVKMRIITVKDNEGKVLGAFEIFAEDSSQAAMAEKVKELQAQAHIDFLTEIPNRRYMDSRLFARVKQMERYDIKFGVLYIDIDKFKDLNDKYGHEIGDRVLKMVAKTMEKNIRPFDTIGRWGGEEFLLIIENVNDIQLLLIANKLRMLVEQSHIFLSGIDIKTTVSVGATLSKPNDSMESIVKRSDEMLYKSKQGGRNRVTID